MSGSINNIGSLTTSLMPPLVTQTPPLLDAIASTGTVTIGGEKWDISAPSDVTIKTPDVNGGVLEFDINYNDQSLLGQTHGIDSINITPEVNDVGNASGFKEPVKFVVTNDMSVPISGFDLFTFNQTPVGVPDANDPTGHPNNYAHFHGIAANPFGPETVTTYLPDFTPAGTSPASEIRATGTLLPGQSVSASAATFHSEEIAGDNNGFGVAFFPIASQATTPPVITGLAPTETTDGVPPFLPFINTSVTDLNALPIEVATITVKDANGSLTDVDALTGTGLTHSGVGTYTMTSLPTELTAQLQALNFKEVSASDTLTLSVDNSGQTGFPKPATASTVVTLTPSTSIDGTTVVTDGPTLTDATSEKWSIVKGQVAVNGVVDQATHRVVAIGYADGKIWQENADKNWWSKTTSSDTWTQGSPPASIAGVVLHVSADNTVLPVTDQNQTIIDVNQNTWSFIGGQVSINGQLDPQTGHGQALAYEGGKVWENADNLWWSKSSPTAPWDPPNGTTVSPVVGGGVPPQPASVAPDTIAVTSDALGTSGPSFLQPPPVPSTQSSLPLSGDSLSSTLATATLDPPTIPSMAGAPDTLMPTLPSMMSAFDTSSNHMMVLGSQ